MRKEVILAVIIGIILGGVILYGINLANNSSTDSGSDQTSNQVTTTPIPSNTDRNDITFVNPQDHAVITDAQVTLKGTTKPSATLAIITESDELIATADAKGNFSSLINLINGENTISVTSVDNKLATASASITVIHTASLP